MAEAVHAELERTVPELIEYQTHGIFSRNEIRAIVRRRERFEYRLHRRGCDMQDYVRYIQFEVNLDALRRLRMERLHVRPGSLMASDYACISRAYTIFQRALKKHRRDVQLWLDFVAFCRCHRNGPTVARAITQALRYHPHKPGLWVLAAQIEFEDNADMAAARALMQRALRVMPQSTCLWHEYFRLELLYWEKMRRREEILGALAVLDGTDAAVQPPGPSALPDSTEAAAKARKAAGTRATDAVVDAAANDADTLMIKRFLSCEVPRLVYQHAVAAIADDVAFRLGFVDISLLFTDTGPLRDAIYEGLASELPNNAQARAAIALRPWREYAARANSSSTVDDEAPAEAAALEALEAACAALPVAAMFEQGARFMLDRAIARGARLSAAPAAPCDSPQARRTRSQRLRAAAPPASLADRLWRLLERARADGTASEPLCTLWLEACDALGATVAQKLSIAQWAVSMVPAALPLWLCRLEVVGTDDAVTLDAILQQALLHLSHADTVKLWRYWCQRRAADRAAVQLAMGTAIRTAPSDVTVSLKLVYADWAAEHLPTPDAARVALSLCETHPVPLTLYLRAAELATAVQPADVPAIRRLFERATASYGHSSADVWLAYGDFERKIAKRIDLVQHVQWRALHTLSDSTAYQEHLVLAGTAPRGVRPRSARRGTA